MSQKRIKIGSLIGLETLFVILWNSGFIGAEWGLPYTRPWTFLLWRYLLLSVGLFVYLILSGRLKKISINEILKEALLGILGHALWLGCVLISLNSGVPGGVVALITALQPLLTGALAGLVVGEPTGAKAWVGLSLGFIGVGLVVGFRLEPQIAWGYLIPFGSAFAMTIASLLKRYWAKSKKQNLLEMVPSLFIQSLSTSLFVLFPAWYIEGLETKWTLPFISTLFWLSIVVSFAAYWCLWRLYEKKQATQVASLFYLSPPVTMVMAWICFGDRIMWSDLCGLLVGAAGVLFVYKEKRPYAVKSK